MPNVPLAQELTPCERHANSEDGMSFGICLFGRWRMVYYLWRPYIVHTCVIVLGSFTLIGIR
jgi:hypothetical protein